MVRHVVLGFLMLIAVAAPPGASAQTPATQELLALVPKDFGFCAVLNDLRGTWQRVEDAPWFKALKASPVGQAIARLVSWRRPELTVRSNSRQCAPPCSKPCTGVSR